MDTCDCSDTSVSISSATVNHNGVCKAKRAKLSNGNLVKNVNGLEMPFSDVPLVKKDDQECQGTISDCSSADKGQHENQVKQEKHAAARWKYEGHNVFFVEGDVYRCSCCDFTSTSCDLAADTKGENNRNDTDLRDFFVKFMVNKHHCQICNMDLLNKTIFKTHVTGSEHAAAKQKYGCDDIAIKNNLFYCIRCDSTLLNRTFALEHVKGETHMEAPDRSNKRDQLGNNIPEEAESVERIPSESHIFKENGTEKQRDDDWTVSVVVNLNCRVCGCTILDHTKINDHVNDNKHTTDLRKFDENKISFKDDKYYCKFCNCKILTLHNVDEHLKGRRHGISLTASNLLEKLTKQSNEEFHDNQIKASNPQEKSVKQSNEEFHDNQISFKNDKYYCKCCDCYIPTRDHVEDHIKGRRHVLSLRASNLQEKLTKQSNEEFHDNEIKASNLQEKSVKQSNEEFHDNQISFKTDKYYCKCCDCNIPTRDHVDDHIKGRRHGVSLRASNLQEKPVKQSNEEFHDNQISFKNNKYYCKCCNCNLQTLQQVDEHLKGRRHSVSLTASNLQEKPVRQSNEAFHDNQIKASNLQKKSVKQSNEEFHDNQISFKTDKYYCKCCDCNIPTRDHVDDHIKGRRHGVSLRASNLQEKPVKQSNEEFHDNQISFKNNKYYCKCCNCNLQTLQQVDEHLKGRRHSVSLTASNLQEKPVRQSNEAFHDNQIKASNLQKKSVKQSNEEFHDNQILFKNDKYHCKCCNCDIPTFDHIVDHLKGRRHGVSLTASNSDKNPTSQSVAKRESITPHSKPPISSLNDELAKSGKSLDAPKSYAQKARQENRPKKKTPANVKFGAEKGSMRCSVCDASVEGATNLHIHQANHFSEEFVVSGNTNASIDQPQSDCTEKVYERFSNDDDNDDVLVKSVERTLNPEKIAKYLNYEVGDIYDMKDRTADVELGVKLCFAIDEERAYCLVCRKIVDDPTRDNWEHLRDLDHCEYLDKMERDDRLFDAHPEQFSELALARQYMQETSDLLVVRCFACDEDVDNADAALLVHVDGSEHGRNCARLDAEARKNFENVKPISCDWYGVAHYWCVPCVLRFRSEVMFARHLKGESHAARLTLKPNAARKLTLDFCAPCALLWYGYRCTWAYHRENKTHVWLAQDGHYVTTELPLSAARLLARPEEYADEAIRHIDDASAREREKEATLVRDIENAICRARVYVFGSRATGLASPDSDIDVFVDCGGTYDGTNSSTERIQDVIVEIYERLSENPESWNVEELRVTSRMPIIKAHHRATGLSCDISFTHGLAVENSLLIKSFNDIFPPCRKINLILKKWLTLCGLSGSDVITSYALCCSVIFYLQRESILPSISELIKMNKKSRIVAGWEVGVSRDFTYNNPGRSFDLKELLIRFFTFYAHFDYQNEVACPLLGAVVMKRAFADYQTLPNEMKLYKDHVKNSGAGFRIDSAMCIQDPFELQANLSKAVRKVHLNRFRTYCSRSLDVLRQAF